MTSRTTQSSNPKSPRSLETAGSSSPSTEARESRSPPSSGSHVLLRGTEVWAEGPLQPVHPLGLRFSDLDVPLLAMSTEAHLVVEWSYSSHRGIWTQGSLLPQPEKALLCTKLYTLEAFVLAEGGGKGFGFLLVGWPKRENQGCRRDRMVMVFLQGRTDWVGSLV